MVDKQAIVAELQKTAVGSQVDFGLEEMGEAWAEATEKPKPPPPPSSKVSVKVTLPRIEAGFGMNIDAKCSIASFTGPDTVAEQHGVKLG
eukprot:SAG31_NODE_35967_length_317_cov_10.357798_1_plen_89_part_01